MYNNAVNPEYEIRLILSDGDIRLVFVDVSATRFIHQIQCHRDLTTGVAYSSLLCSGL